MGRSVHLISISIWLFILELESKFDSSEAVLGMDSNNVGCVIDALFYSKLFITWPLKTIKYRHCVYGFIRAICSLNVCVCVCVCVCMCVCVRACEQSIFVNASTQVRVCVSVCV